MKGTRSMPGVRHLKRYSTWAAGYWCSTTCIIENLYKSVSGSESMIISDRAGMESGHYPRRHTFHANRTVFLLRKKKPHRPGEDGWGLSGGIQGRKCRPISYARS